MVNLVSLDNLNTIPRQQLEDAKADMSNLREQMNKAGRIIRQRSSDGDDTKSKSKRESREASVRKMEELQLKHSSLKQDLQRLLDEKEDMVKEKEDMNIKVWMFFVLYIFVLFIQDIFRFTD